MDDKERKRIVDDAIKMGILITTCLGCGKPYCIEDAEKAKMKYSDCGCPAGTGLSWNPLIVEVLK